MPLGCTVPSIGRPISIGVNDICLGPGGGQGRGCGRVKILRIGDMRGIPGCRTTNWVDGQAEVLGQVSGERPN